MKLNGMHSLVFCAVAMCASSFAVKPNYNTRVNQTFNHNEYLNNKLTVPMDGTIVEYPHLKIAQLEILKRNNVIQSLRTNGALEAIKKIK